MPLFLYIFFIFLLHYIHSYNHSLITFAEALLHIFIAAGSVGGTSLGCRDEIRTRACLTASQRTTIWATLHPSVLCCTLLNYAAPFWAMLHPSELRCTLIFSIKMRAILAKMWALHRPTGSADHLSPLLAVNSCCHAPAPLCRWAACPVVLSGCFPREEVLI